MGPKARYLGPEVPAEDLIWQDPLPDAGDYWLSDGDIADLKRAVVDSGLSVADLISTAWASASTFRKSDRRGGANGARIRLEPQRSWEANQGLDRVIDRLDAIRRDSGKSISLADLIVLGGCVAVEQAAQAAGYQADVPFTPRRVDATQEQTDPAGSAVLEPRADGFRNFLRSDFDFPVPVEELLIDKAELLGLSA